ncbi:putative reverse transcriptase domain-containing protein [Tanacetum coccineum]|uniref:Reverse transcriptase domain-containing protein n=1 Tax=Tanacetum coccineum TaxID=301880 RepID=A0ABQ5FH93_9ASTR
MSADSAVTYTSVHSEARSWSIPSEDPYEEAAQQLFEQAPRSARVPAEDEAPIPPLPPSFLAPRIRPLSPRALEVEMRDVASAYYHSLHPSGTPPLLPIPLPAPSTSRRADIPEADTPPRKRLLLTTPRPGCEIGESSAAAAARQPGPTIETRLRDTERRIMTALELVNRRVTYQKMAPKRTTRSTRVPPVTPAPTTTTVTEAQLQALIDQGVAAAMAEAEASRVRNATTSMDSSTEVLSRLLDDDALTWWNAHVKTTTTEAAHAMPWAALKKMMTDKYCPRGEIKKIETEMWNLKVKGTDVVAYSRRFQQLALMCSRMFPEEIDKIEKYIGGLPDMILGSVKASKSKTMQEVIEFTTELMEDKTHAYAERQAERKRKNDDLSKNNQNQQNKRQNTGQAYTAGNSERKSYAGSKPLCSKCNYNHEGPCPPKCSNCKRVGHATKDCRTRPSNNNNNNRNNNNNNNRNNNNNNNNNRNNNNNNQQGNGFFECRAEGHFKRNCPRLRNNDCGNQAGNDRAPAKVMC